MIALHKNGDNGSPLLEAEDLVVRFPIRSPLLRLVRGWIHAVRGVSFKIGAGESLGIVGESGCGKSTLAECIVRLTNPSEGRMFFEGEDVTDIDGAALRRFRRQVQIVAQDPFESLNPRLTVRQLIKEPLQIHRLGTPLQQERRVEELCIAVGIDPGLADRRPTTFSGGQRQRIAIARALSVGPKLLVLDEPVSALDISVQAQILNLLSDLRQKLNLSYIFISHDIGAVRQVCDRVGVMYLGKFVELGTSSEVMHSPIHPYTRALLDAAEALELDCEIDLASFAQLAGEVPSPANPPSGCAFRTRCVNADSQCEQVDPVLREFSTGHLAATHHPVKTALWKS